LKIPNIVIRILAGAVFVILLLAGILVNEYTFLVLFSAITVLSLYEFYKLVEVNKNISITKGSNIIGGLFLFTGAFCYGLSDIGAILFIPYLAYFLYTFISELYRKRQEPIISLAYSIFGQVYIALPLALTNYLVFANGNYQPVFILAVLLFIWVNDSFAYLSGRAFGKHKLFERISPKKTWEGFAGGLLASVIASLIFSHFYSYLPVPAWIGFAVLTVVFGTLGDLFESMIKRSLAVKDSGKIIPGHGGILDRFDSTILSIPAAVVYLLIFGFLNSYIQ